MKRKFSPKSSLDNYSRSKRRRLSVPNSQTYAALEPRQLLAVDLLVTEFMASNKSTIVDGHGEASDWIEIHNRGDEAANLVGYSLTDNALDSTKFVLPTTTVSPGQHLVVFASANNGPDPNGNIHTNFKLSAGGEYLGFFDPDGVLLSEFGAGGEDYIQQGTDVSFGLDIVGGNYQLNSQRFYLSPSPGGLNTPQFADLAPVITSVDKPTSAAHVGQSIVVTAEPIVLSGSLTNVSLFARVNYSSELSLSFVDNGSGADAVAGDGVYTGTIPNSLFAVGDMVRWRFAATSSNGLTGRGPTFLSTTQSPEYFGTVVADASVNTPLPVLEYFTNNPNGAQGSGARGSVFYNGEFYDNVFIRRRGQSSNNSPKKNLKFDFNPGDRFLLDPSLQRVDEININNTYYDNTDIKATLAAEVFVKAGSPAPITFPLHTRRNGEFFSLAVYVEQVDDVFLARNGLDPLGALYKSTGNNGFAPEQGLQGFEKNTREFEDFSDLQTLANAVNPSLPQSVRTQYLYDNVDVASVINYLAVQTIINNSDHVHKNHYVYRDTRGTGKWSFLPWDLDLTFGKGGANTPSSEEYLGDTTNAGLDAYTNDHPFFGSSDYWRFNRPEIYNRLIDAVLDTPEFRDQYVRRLRTVMDIALQSSDTPESGRWLENRLVELRDQIQADYLLDDAKWVEAPQTNTGANFDWGPELPLSEFIGNIGTIYAEQRRAFLYDFHNIDNAATETQGVALVDTTDTLRFLAPATGVQNWQSVGFDDSSWTFAPQGVGFDRGGGSYTNLISAQGDVESELFGVSNHVYTRSEFTIGSAAELSGISDLLLEASYDDGFIAYVNGFEVARDTGPSGTTGSGLSASTGSHESGGFQMFNLSSSAVDALSVGTNVLAIHGINVRNDSSDLLLTFRLLTDVTTPGGGTTPDSARIPNEQVANPAIAFDTNDFDANPISGNQGQEYLRLNNLNNTAVDLSGWRLSGGIELTFRPGTVIPAGGQLFAVADVQAFLARTSGPTGGQNRLTQGNYDGQLGITGETVQLIAADGQVMDTFSVPATIGTDLQSSLRITEINYNPSSPTDAEEFIEFTNISSGGSSTTLDLSGVSITDGPSAPFVFPAGTTISPGQRLLVVKDVGAFQAMYPSVSTSQIAGQYAGSLSNGGERLRVEDAGGNTIFDIDYADSHPWSPAADGGGASLQLIDELSTPFERLGKFYSWTHSAANSGTPGAAPAVAAGVVINEVLAHSDVPAVDAIELHNPTASPMDVGGWYLSDSSTDADKFQIPAGSVIAAGGYLVFDESDFNPTPNAAGVNDFALSSSAGDQVYLTQVVGGEVTRFEDVVDFAASLNGQFLGRQTNGSNRLAPLAAGSLGAVNRAFATSPVIISEVNYHPAQPSSAAVAEFAAVTASDLEFVELHNPMSSGVNLTEWRLRGDVDYDLPAMILSPGETIVVVSFNPAEPANADLKGAFEAEYGISGDSLHGPFTGSLSNGSGRVTLSLPDGPPVGQPTIIARVVADELIYDDLSPWADADGSGQSLNRTAAAAFGNAATSWLAVTPTPGSASLTLTPPIVVEVARDGGSIVRPDLLSTLEFIFDQDVVSSANALSLVDAFSGSAVDLTGIGFSYSPGAFAATWDVSGIDLDAGYYELVIDSDVVQSAATGTALDGNEDAIAGDDFRGVTVYVAIPGDANLDGTVNVLGDASRLVNNLTITSGATWADGDFNGDGQVDVLGDASILVNNLGRTVSPPATAALSRTIAVGQEEHRSKSVALTRSSSIGVTDIELTLAGSVDTHVDPLLSEDDTMLRNDSGGYRWENIDNSFANFDEFA